MQQLRRFATLILPIVRYSAAVVCAMLAAVFVALPFSSGWSQTGFRTLGGRWEYLVDGTNGRLQFILLHDLPSPIDGPIVPMGASGAYITFVNRFPRSLFWEKGDFGVESGWEIGTGTGNPNRQVFAEGSRYWVMVPCWAAAIATGGMAGMLWLTAPIRSAMARRKRLRALVAGGVVCSNCAYDLRATPDRCPECGLVQVTRFSSIVSIAQYRPVP